MQKVKYKQYCSFYSHCHIHGYNVREFFRIKGFKKFLDFLEENNALCYFFENFGNESTQGDDLLNFFKETDSYSWIFDAFIWNVTPQEFDYWHGIHQAWTDMFMD